MRALLLIGLAVAGLGGAAWYGGWLDGLRVPPATRAPAVGEPSWRDAGAAGYTDAQFAAAMEAYARLFQPDGKLIEHKQLP